MKQFAEFGGLDFKNNDHLVIVDKWAPTHKKYAADNIGLYFCQWHMCTHYDIESMSHEEYRRLGDLYRFEYGTSSDGMDMLMIIHRGALLATIAYNDVLVIYDRR